MTKKKYILLIVFSALCCSLSAQTEGPTYLCELGFQAGCGYYVGDGAEHIFMHPREAYGLQFRYKFTKRWALQVKATTQRITGWNHDEDMHRLDTKWENQLINTDIVAEFNFFRFGSSGVYVMAYFPFGIGFKWKFSERAGLNIAWQHNVYLADNIENGLNLNDTYGLNGSNILNCDLTGMITVGMVFEFGQAKNPCRICNW